MEAIILLMTQVVPPLIKLGVDALPLITAAKNTVTALQTGNHITAEQAAELRKLTETREAEWQEVLKAAEAESGR